MKPRILVLLTIAVAGLAGAPFLLADGEARSNPTLTNCAVVVRDRVQVPAREAGALVEFNIVEGMVVAQGDLLGRVDDEQPQLQLKLAQAEWEVADEQAKSEFDILYSDKAADVAEVELLKTEQANRQRPNTFSEIEVQYKQLNMEKLSLQAAKARFDKVIAEMSALAKKYEIDAADMMIRRRHLVAPIAGEVTAVARRQGEWVNPGDPVLEITNLETLYVKGWVFRDHYAPGDIEGKPVTVDVTLDEGGRDSLGGVIFYVNKDISIRGDYQVWAVVKNRKTDRGWRLQPGDGVTAQMTIHIDSPAVAADARREVPGATQ